VVAPTHKYIDWKTKKAIKKAWRARWGNINTDIVPPMCKEFKLGFVAGAEDKEKKP